MRRWWPAMLTTPSTPKLSEAARHLVIPEGIVTSTFPRVYRRLRAVGVTFDPWQVGFSTVALGCRADGKYAATVGGVTASIPRQVGKTFTVGNLLIGLALEFPGTRIVWTSHHSRTTTNTFRSMQGMVRRKKIFPLLAANGIRTANGEQEIRFANGSLIMFGAREHGFGRGMDAIDVLVFDEAQILGLKALEDMVPATNQAKHPHGALVFFIGTPPRPIDDGEAFTTKRADALEGRDSDTFYVELSADEDADPDDHEQWRKANPSFPHRTPLESMLRMRKNLPSEESWLREALGVWDPLGSEQVIPAESWQHVADSNSLPTSRFVLAIDVDPAQTTGSVAFAGLRPDGRIHVELDEQRKGIGWIVPYVAERYHRNEIAAVVIDARSPAAALLEDFKRQKVHRIVQTDSGEMATACAQFYQFATEDGLRHTDQPQLSVSLASARKRPLGDRWAWNRKTIDADITPIVAATLAAWGVKAGKVRGGAPAGEKRGRRVVTW